MSLLVKICGITNLADAQAAVDAGADALGFMFYEPSARNIAPAAAREIIAQLPPRVAKVGVFVNAPAEVIHRMAAECGLDTVQLHGEETPEFCAQFASLKVWKAVRVRDEGSLRALPAYETDAWLLDSYVAGHAGGTGEKFNWELAVAAKALGRPIILAGGLTPANIAAAVQQVRPFGVDVSSGVEAAPGRKDAAKMRAFIGTAKVEAGGKEGR
ncbi:MAG: phosphoribosylanthranilate isomerase [Pedosphaera sp.]|nr:phosphoribosylanthranilate isomerase [Pedosphaera sp.]